MLRTQLFDIALRHGYARGRKLSQGARLRIERDLRDYFVTDVGQQALVDAPRVHYMERGELKDRAMSTDDAVRALLEELDAASRVVA